MIKHLPYLILFLILGGYSFPVVAETRYVDSAATGANNGTSWTNAYISLADAVVAAHSNTSIDTILVAQGTYYPEYIPPTASFTTDRDKTFYFLRDGLAVLGGYPTGGGTRDYTTNLAILSGDVGTLNDSTDNAYHVVLTVGTTSTPLDTTLIIDGFTITKGNANIYNDISIGTQLVGRSHGGGLFNHTSSSIVRNCIIIENTAVEGGGGMLNYSSSSPLVINCTFSENTAGNGGGLFNWVNSSPVVSHCIFSGNTATDNHGGGLLNHQGCSPLVTNCIFINNTADGGGGMCNHTNCSPSVSNSTFSGNTAGINGGGIFNHTNSNPDISNSIIYGNNTGIVNTGSSTPVITYSLVQGESSTANGNLDGTVTDPLFVNPAAGDYRLLLCSPVINIGNNDSIPAGITTDLDRNMRIFNTTVDMGAYEHQAVPFLHTMHYVRAGGTGNGDSWATASGDLQAAIDGCNTEEVWVAEGIYHPVRPANNLSTVDSFNRDNAFVLRNGVKIYGGFPATGNPVFGDRNPDTYETVLSADYNNNDGVSGSGSTLNITNNSENAHHVVIGAGIDTTAVLDGFTLKGGNANGGASTITVNSQNIGRNNGGGAYIRNATPTMSDLKVSGNYVSSGGGFFNSINASPVLTNIVVTGNIAAFNGSGIYNHDNSSPVMTNITVMGNRAAEGGAGIYNNLNSHPVLTNATISGNYAGTLGGGMYNNSSSLPMLVNVTITGNVASSGGGMRNSASSNPRISNSIIYGNNTGIVNVSSTPVITYSLVQGLTSTANGNLNGNTTNPLFVNPVAPALAPTTAGDYRLQFCSPAINAGYNDSISAGINTDISGNPRIVAATVDMGAYEKQSSMDNFEDNAALSKGSSNTIAFLSTCEDDDDWTWYADPNNPDSLSFAIKWGTGNNTAKASAEVLITVDANHHLASNSIDSATIVMKRYWNVDIGNNTLNNPVSILFFFDAADTAGMRTEIDAENVGSSGSVVWFKTGNAPYTPSLVSHNDINNGDYTRLAATYGTVNGIAYVQFDTITSFSGGTGGIGAGAGSPLPLDLLGFTAKAVDNSKVHLEWHTANEMNVAHICIERSVDAREWIRIAEVKAKGEVKNVYDTWDNNPYNGNNFYRLKITDNDGKFTYSRIEKVIFTNGGNARFNVYPNPANGIFTLEAEGIGIEGGTLHITDVLGRNVYSAKVKEGNNTIVPVKLRSGMYNITVQYGDKVFMQQLVME